MKSRGMRQVVLWMMWLNGKLYTFTPQNRSSVVWLLHNYVKQQMLDPIPYEFQSWDWVLPQQNFASFLVAPSEDLQCSHIQFWFWFLFCCWSCVCRNFSQCWIGFFVLTVKEVTCHVWRFSGALRSCNRMNGHMKRIERSDMLCLGCFPVIGLNQSLETKSARRRDFALGTNAPVNVQDQRGGRGTKRTLSTPSLWFARASQWQIQLRSDPCQSPFTKS